MMFKLFFLLFISILEISDTTLSQSDKAKSKSKSPKYRIKVTYPNKNMETVDIRLEGEQVDSVFDRNLVVEEPTAKDIIQEHATHCIKKSYRNFDGKVLAYVTPWNNRGYDIAKNFTAKFTDISPVWLQLRRRAANQYQVTGTQDIDANWIKALRKENPRIRIVPRVLFDGWTVQDFTALFSQISEQENLAIAVSDLCVNHKFQGIVLELWTQIGGSVASNVLVDFLKLFAKILRQKDLDVTLVIPPYRGGEKDIFGANHFDALYGSISAFSLMTYDFSSVARPGPNSPFSWAKECVKRIAPENNKKRSKILLGLNFYGNKYTSSGGGPILGKDFVELLKSYKGKLTYDEASVENYFEVRTAVEKSLVFFPTLYSIHRRLQLATELGTGISIWEIGQGLDYFYDLL